MTGKRSNDGKHGGGWDVTYRGVIIGVRKVRRSPAPTDFNGIRLSEITRLIKYRHGGPCQTEDASIYGEIAVHYVAPKSRRAWLANWCPGMSVEEVEFALQEAATAPRYLDSVIAGEELRVTGDERRVLDLRTIHARVPRRHGEPCPYTKDQIRAKAEAERRHRQNERKREQRAKRAAAKPQKQTRSDIAKAQGISRTTEWRRRKKEGGETDVRRQ